MTYEIDPDDPDAPVLLPEYDVPGGPIRPLDTVIYVGEMPLPGEFKVVSIWRFDAEDVLAEMVDVMGDTYEVNANNLRRVESGGRV